MNLKYPEIFKKYLKRNYKWILALLAIIIPLFQYLSTEREKQVFNRPYLSIAERNNLIFGNNYQPTFKVHVNNNGKLPARFIANLEGWPCTISSNQNSSDYIAPNENIELSFQLKIGCRVSTENLCKIIENMKLILTYGLPSMANFQYTTVLKTKLIPAVDDTSYIKIVGCGAGNIGQNLVPVWYIDKME